jgi:hypothetical protein
MIPSYRMRDGIAALAFAITALTAASAACVSGDVDEEKRTETVPAGTDPEAATFQITRRHDGTQQALVIRLSTISMCERPEVPQSHQFVELELVIPADGVFEPETCKLDQAFRCRLRLARTTAPECASSAGPIAAFGQVQIDEVTENVVRGSFAGTNPDSKLDLRGSFVAKPCLGTDACP